MRCLYWFLVPLALVLTPAASWAGFITYDIGMNTASLLGYCGTVFAGVPVQ